MFFIDTRFLDKITDKARRDGLGEGWIAFIVIYAYWLMLFQRRRK